jgi:hypothetical protein
MERARRAPALLESLEVLFTAHCQLGSSGGKARPDYSGYQDWRKRDLIATIPELLSRALKRVAR